MSRRARYFEGLERICSRLGLILSLSYFLLRFSGTTLNFGQNIVGIDLFSSKYRSKYLRSCHCARENAFYRVRTRVSGGG